jgi:hypothetical protein
MGPGVYSDFGQSIALIRFRTLMADFLVRENVRRQQVKKITVLSHTEKIPYLYYSRRTTGAI